MKTVEQNLLNFVGFEVEKTDLNEIFLGRSLTGKLQRQTVGECFVLQCCESGLYLEVIDKLQTGLIKTRRLRRSDQHNSSTLRPTSRSSAARFSRSGHLYSGLG
ncbi:hypothetical protein ElyMa_001095000 [Elysia marginata]|uniref:Uncharacterized protein n=1 Tax=Elysia marginata TaxID=1093978 RepID=A0AAV4HVH4_9GAST|nr:hypothetical protein ElyMa_001095000 [Elysia marginata]